MSENIIGLFGEYMQDSKSCDDFILWTAISSIAGAVGRKVWVSRNGYQIYPNLYVLLVGKPGSTYKTSAIRNAAYFLSKLPQAGVLPENMTPAAMLNRMAENSRKKFAKLSGQSYCDGSGFIYSGEIVNILGKSKYGNMLNLLTELYDSEPNGWGHENAFIKETLVGGELKIYNPCINMLGATTPGAFHKDIVTRDEIKSGFTSRLLIIYDAIGSTKKAIWNEEEDLAPKKLSDERLISRLKEVALLSGPMKPAKSFISRHLEFMEANEAMLRLLHDERMQSFYGRKPTSLLKIATLISLSDSSSMELNLTHWDLALKLLDDVETKSNPLFSGIGDNKNTQAIKKVFDLIRFKKIISSSEISNFFWKDIDSRTLDEVLNILTRMNRIAFSPIEKKYVILDESELN